MELAAIYKFVSIDERLATAGQPTEQQLAGIRDRGFEVVINLGLLDPRYCLADEAGSVSSLGLSYHHIPVNFQEPQTSDFDEFRRVMKESAGRRVFVHCAANMRVSCFVALFGELELGWNREQAESHIRRVWEPNEAWTAFLKKVRTEHLGS